jgi:hypothetical protein
MQYSFFQKPVESVLLVQKEVNTLKKTGTSTSNYPVYWTQYDRTVDGEKDIFVSLNLPATYEDFLPTCDISRRFPELQFLNVDKIIVGTIQREVFSDFINGSTIEFTLPTWNIISPPSTVPAKYIRSATYFSVSKRQDCPLLGESIAFLFCDQVARKFTGTTSGGIQIKDTGATISWTAATQYNYPATSLSQLDESDYFSDSLNFSGLMTSKFNRTDLPIGYPFTSYKGYNYDVPVGFVDLKRGFIVLTAYDLVEYFPWLNGYYLNDPFDSYNGTKENIGFRDQGLVQFYDTSIKYNVEAVFEAQPYEFFMSSNPTWDLEKNISIFQSGGTGYDSVYFTEVGMYNKNGELLAVSKFNQPVQKRYEQLMNFEMRVKI